MTLTHQQLTSNDPQTDTWQLEHSRRAVAEGQEHRRKITTQIIVYIQETGSEPVFGGSNVEIKGEVKTWGTASATYPIDVRLPEHTNFSNEHNGLGRMIFRVVVPTIREPPNFTAHIYEEGGAASTKKILTRTVDWASTDDVHLWGFWWWRDVSPEDANFKAFLAWSVDDVPLSV